MMTKNVFITSLLSLALAFGISSCGVKMRPLVSNMAQSEPQPLEVVGGKVPAIINITFPEKWFPPKATLKIIPVLRYAEGEKSGASYTFQGEKILGNYPIVSYEKGGNVSLHFSVPYIDDRMRKSDLYLTFDAYNDGDKVNIPDIKVGTGVVATSQFASAKNTIPLFAPDGFERIMKDTFDANIMFDIQNAKVNKSRLKDEAIEEWRDIVENAKETPNQEVSVEVRAYASPDGGVKLNTNLSENREKNTKKAIKQEFGKINLDNVAIDSYYTAQDWEGFRELVEGSNIPDKDLIIRILEMYPNSEQREEQIKNLSTVFSRLADEVLPKLRRSRLIANVTTIGKSDEEIQSWLSKYPGMLSLDELLHAATLQNTLAKKEYVYNLVKKIYPKEYRAYNNLGVLAWQRGDRDMASFWFDMAEKKRNNPYSTINKGLEALSNGNISKAKELIAVGASIEEAAPIIGLLYLMEGQYSNAQKAYGNTKSNNAAIAQIMNMDYSAAIKTLNAIAQPNADTYYLLAVVSARTNDPRDLFVNLEKAIKEKPSLKYRALTDLEFRNYSNDPTFKSLVN